MPKLSAFFYKNRDNSPTFTDGEPKKVINFLEPLTLDEFQSLESYCLDHLDCSTVHTHHGQICKSPNMKYVFSYTRYYITFHNDNIIEEQKNVGVVYCGGCKHYHAILPNIAIVPYGHYSIFFILCVIYDKQFNKLKVADIVEKYNISVSTLYRWLDKYKYYYSIYQQLRNKYCMHFFTCLIEHYEEIIADLFDICAQALFQYNRKLSQHPPATPSASPPTK